LQDGLDATGLVAFGRAGFSSLAFVGSMTLHRFVLAVPGLALGLGLGLGLGLLFGLVPDLVPGAAAATEAAKPPDPFPPTLIFYIAKGGPDACGQGCDTWIAAEGRIDGEAAARLRKFFRQHKDRKLPIYFHSPVAT